MHYVRRSSEEDCTSCEFVPLMLSKNTQLQFSLWFGYPRYRFGYQISDSIVCALLRLVSYPLFQSALDGFVGFESVLFRKFKFHTHSLAFRLISCAQKLKTVNPDFYVVYGNCLHPQTMDFNNRGDFIKGFCSPELKTRKPPKAKNKNMLAGENPKNRSCFFPWESTKGAEQVPWLIQPNLFRIWNMCSKSSFATCLFTKSLTGSISFSPYQWCSIFNLILAT